MKDLISVIIPIYNVEKYLRNCIDTVINQTYSNIEIILVNDGSTDSSLKICNEYKEKDNRITIINKENGGVSDARNAGLKNAHGKYICFVDSDDYISEKFVEKLYNTIILYNVKIALCNMERVDEVGKSISKKEIISQVIPGKKIIENLYDNNFWPVFVVLCNKMYDITLFKDITFPVGKIHEDESNIHKLCYLAENVAIISDVLYYYRKVETSITNRRFNIERLDALTALEERIKFFKENKEEKLYRLALIEYQKLIITSYINCKLYLNNTQKILETMIKKFRKNYREVIKFNECLVIDKFKFTVAYISLDLYFYMKRISMKK